MMVTKTRAPWLVVAMLACGLTHAMAQQSDNPAKVASNNLPAATSAATADSSSTSTSSADAMQGNAVPPLSFKIGDFDFTPGGFMDLTSVWRSVAEGSGIGTNFAGIQFNTPGTGRVSEFRMSAQNSRLTLKVSGKVNGNDYYGYLETDFLGNQANNISVSNGADVMRMRVFFMDGRFGQWEFVGGQDWSLLTPNKVGLSPMPSDIFYTSVMDVNYHVGLTWARQAQFRVLYHASDNFTAGISVENPDQYVGGSGGLSATAVTLPAAPATILGQLDNASSFSNSAGLAPDIIGKLAYDSAKGGHGVHAEVGGLFSTFRVFDSTINATSTKSGGGLEANLNAEAAPGLHVIVNTYLSDGGGRYFFGSAPDVIVGQDGTLSLVHTSGGMGGFEYQMNPAWLLYGYYGGMYVSKNYQVSTATPVGPTVGYGFPGSSNSDNRSIQEYTLGVTHTFWKSPQWGALQLITQASWVNREPWFVAANAPRNAHVAMGFADIRYTLP